MSTNKLKHIPHLACFLAALFPTLRGQARVDFLHPDAIFYGTYQPTEIASYTLLLIDARDTLQRSRERSLIQPSYRSHGDFLAALRLHLRRCAIGAAVQMH